MSGVTPRFSSRAPPEVTKSARLSVSFPPSGRLVSWAIRTDPPVFSPTTMPRRASCKAAGVSSAALRLPWSTRTATSLARGSRRSPQSPAALSTTGWGAVAPLPRPDAVRALMARGWDSSLVREMLQRTEGQSAGGAMAAVLARELTKTFEEFRRGPLGDLAADYADKTVKGEIVLVIGPPAPDAAPDAADVDSLLTELSATMPTAKAATEAAKLTGLPRKDLYQRLLELKGAA